MIKIDVAAIINELPINIRFRDFGFIAGSWVAAEVFKQLNVQVNPVANDIDWFVDLSSQIGLSSCYDKDAALFEGLNMTGFKSNYVDRVNASTREFEIEYGELTWEVVRDYSVIASRRIDNDVNIINVNFNRLREGQCLTLINNFDINAIQVGIDMQTKQLYATDQFWYFCKSRQLEIVSLHTPMHSIIRYLKKKKELECYGDDVFNTKIVAAALQDPYFSASTTRFGKITYEKAVQVEQELNKLGFEIVAQQLTSITDKAVYIYYIKHNGNAPFYLDLYQIFGGEILLDGKYPWLEIRYDQSDEERGLPSLTPRNIWTVSNLVYRGSKSELSYIQDIYRNIPSENTVRMSFNWKAAVAKPEFFIGQKYRHQKSFKPFDRLAKESPYFVWMVNSLGASSDNAYFLEKFKKAVEKQYGLIGTGIIESQDFLREITLTVDELSSEDYTRAFAKIDELIIRYEGELTQRMFEKQTINDIEVQHLVSTIELMEEGARQSHCVGGYSSSVARGSSQIITVVKPGKPRITFELQPLEEAYQELGKWHIRQAKIKRNDSPDPEWLNAAKEVLTPLLGRMVTSDEFWKFKYTKDSAINFMAGQICNGAQQGNNNTYVGPEIEIDEECIPF